MDYYISDIAIGISLAILILFVGMELVKYIRANRKFTNYHEAFKTAILMKIAKERDLPVEEYLYVEKEHKSIEKMINTKIVELLEAKLEESKPKKTEKDVSGAT